MKNHLWGKIVFVCPCEKLKTLLQVLWLTQDFASILKLRFTPSPNMRVILASYKYRDSYAANEHIGKQTSLLAALLPHDLDRPA